MEKNDNFTIGDLSVKCKSKTELNNLLARERKIYLPSKQDASQSYFRDILQGNKFYLKSDEVTVVKVPQYKGLRVNDIIKFTSSNLDITKFLPKYSYQKSLIENGFEMLSIHLWQKSSIRYIESKVEIRKQEIINSQNIGILQSQNSLKSSKILNQYRAWKKNLTSLRGSLNPQMNKLKLESSKKIHENSSKVGF